MVNAIENTGNQALLFFKNLGIVGEWMRTTEEDCMPGGGWRRRGGGDAVAFLSSRSSPGGAHPRRADNADFGFASKVTASAETLISVVAL